MISKIINARLKLQSTIRSLEQDFGVRADFKYLTSDSFLSVYKTWDQSKQNKFLVVLGGRVNFKQTKSIIEEK